MAGENAPGKHPLPLPESWECRWSGKQPDRLWAEGGVKPGISRVLLHKIPQAFQPCKVEVHGGEKESAYFSGWLCRSKDTQAPLREHPSALPVSKDPFFVSEGGSSSPSGNLG